MLIFLIISVFQSLACGLDSLDKLFSKFLSLEKKKLFLKKELGVGTFMCRFQTYLGIFFKT